MAALITKNWCPLYPIKLYTCLRNRWVTLSHQRLPRWLLCFAEQKWRCQSQRRARYKGGSTHCHTAQEAMDVADKIIRYDVATERFGEWRLKPVLRRWWGWQFARKWCRWYCHRSFARNPLINQQRFISMPYRQENTPGGERYNDAGRLPSTSRWIRGSWPGAISDTEVPKVLPKSVWWSSTTYKHGQTTTNWACSTPTCSFSGYDDPSVLSGGELALLNPKEVPSVCWQQRDLFMPTKTNDSLPMF